jgi:multidrug resistance efflux pump
MPQTDQIDRSGPGGAPSASDLIDRLSRFQGPPAEFLANLLAVQCHLAAASAGAILRAVEGDHVDVAAVFPPLKDKTPPVWLAQAVESGPEVFAAGRTAVKPLHGPDDLYGQKAAHHLVMIPLKGAEQKVRGVAVFLVDTGDPTALRACQERLELSLSLLSLYEMRLAFQQRHGDLKRLRTGMELLAAVNEQDRFTGAAMATCNEVAAKWQAERVCLGFLQGRYVRAVAMSHTEKFSRKMKIVQDLEAAMEECLDQDVEIVHPPAAEATYVARAAGELSKRHGPSNVVSLPMRKAGEPAAVLTVEWAPDATVDAGQVESLRLACDLCTPRLVSLREKDRWFGAKAARATRKGLGVLVGAKHTWAKVAAVLVCGFVAFLYFAKGDYNADASFVFQATQRQVVAAPFDGFLEDVHVDVDQAVIAGETVLATMDRSSLRLRRGALDLERIAYLKQADLAMRDGKTAESQIANAQRDKVAAQIRLLDDQISKARIVAPISGVVILGDLERHRGVALKTGETLFHIAPLKELRAELSVPEDQIKDIKVGLEGMLAAAGYADRKIPFEVERISPIAEVVDQQNVFKVRVKLLQREPWMRLGMEGVAKVTLGEERYAWLWSRRLVNWVRMKLWL